MKSQAKMAASEVACQPYHGLKNLARVLSFTACTNVPIASVNKPASVWIWRTTSKKSKRHHCPTVYLHCKLSCPKAFSLAAQQKSEDCPNIGLLKPFWLVAVAGAFLQISKRHLRVFCLLLRCFFRIGRVTLLPVYCLRLVATLVSHYLNWAFG